MNQQTRERMEFVAKGTVIHTLTYLLFGLIASKVFDYRSIWDTGIMATVYRSFDHPLVMAGPLLQVFRGMIYGLVLLPFRDRIMEMREGWLAMWGLFWGIGIFGTFAAPPGSYEGLIYTNYSLFIHTVGTFEVYGQSLALALCWYFWEKNRKEGNMFSRVLLSILAGLVSFLVFLSVHIPVAALSGAGTEARAAADPSLIPVYVGLGASVVAVIVTQFLLLKPGAQQMRKFIQYAGIFGGAFLVPIALAVIVSGQAGALVLEIPTALIAGLILGAVHMQLRKKKGV